VAAALIVLTGCLGDGGSDRLISEHDARDIAAKSSGWHADRVTAHLATYSPHPARGRTYRVWVVTYRGGDVCVPLHGPNTAGFGITTFELTIDAHTGKVLAEGSSGRPATCFG